MLLKKVLVGGAKPEVKGWLGCSAAAVHARPMHARPVHAGVGCQPGTKGLEGEREEEGEQRPEVSDKQEVGFKGQIS